jgi:hypothetical protein
VLRKALLLGRVLAVLLLAHRTASGEVPGQVRLEYERQEGAAACPDETAIRTGVAARLGYDPFRERASDRVRATVRQSGAQLEARIELRDGQGNLRAERRLVSRGRDCAELAASVELAIAIAIDPIASTAARASAERADDKVPAPAAVTAPSPSPSAEVTATSPPSPGPPLTPWLAAALLGAAGSAPAPNVGLLLSGGAAGSLLSLGVEARADLPADKALRAGEASAYLLVGSLVPCVHLGRAALCALGTAGARRVAGHGLVHQRSATLTYVGIGARIGVGFPVGDRLSLTLHGDATAPLTRNHLTVDDQVVWTSPAVAVALALGLHVRFP